MNPETAQIQIRLLLKKQSDQGLPVSILWIIPMITWEQKEKIVRTFRTFTALRSFYASLAGQHDWNTIDWPKRHQHKYVKGISYGLLFLCSTSLLIRNASISCHFNYYGFFPWITHRRGFPVKIALMDLISECVCPYQSKHMPFSAQNCNHISSLHYRVRRQYFF